MCFIDPTLGMADAKPTRPGKPQRRPEDTPADPEQERLSSMFGLGPGRDLVGTIAAARKALEQGAGGPASPTTSPGTGRSVLPGLPLIRRGGI